MQLLGTELSTLEELKVSFTLLCEISQGSISQKRALDSKTTTTRTTFIIYILRNTHQKAMS